MNNNSLSKFDAFDLVNLDAFDNVELPLEERVVFSSDMEKLIYQEVKKAVSTIPLGKIIFDILKKSIPQKEQTPNWSKQIDQTKEELKKEIEKIKQEKERIIEQLKKEHAVLRNEILNTPKYQFGGFAPPNPLDHSGHFLSTDGTYNGISWESIVGMSIGNPVVGGTPGSILFIDSSGNLNEDPSQFTYDDNGRLLVIDNGVGTAGNFISGLYNATLADHAFAGAAGFFNDGTHETYLGDGTYSIRATGPSLFSSTMTLSGGRLVFDTAPSNGNALVWSTANTRWQPGTPSGTINIGDPVGGGTAYSILYVDSVDNLKQYNSNFYFLDDSTDTTLGIKSTATGRTALDITGVSIFRGSLLLASGTTTAAPLVFTSSTLKTTPSAGDMEFLTDDLYFTQTTSTNRHLVAWQDNPISQQVFS